MEKLRLKPRNFKFAPLKGWLGGDMTEKVEGWKCTVYEAAGKVRPTTAAAAAVKLSCTHTQPVLDILHCTSSTILLYQ
jgi:hypothetical protein